MTEPTGSSRVGELARDPGFRDWVKAWIVAIAGFIVGLVASPITLAALFVLVGALLIPPLSKARGEQRRRRWILLLAALATAALVAGMASMSVLLGLLALVAFFGAFVFGGMLGRASRIGDREAGPRGVGGGS
jgi:sugar phosphate permease